jgi:hypothetical protein
MTSQPNFIPVDWTNGPNVTTVGMPDGAWPVTYTITTGLPQVVCPDLLTIDRIGEADGLRGKVVRGFFWALRWWKP